MLSNVKERVRSSSRRLPSLSRPFSRKGGKRSVSVDGKRLPPAEQPSRLSLNTGDQTDQPVVNDGNEALNCKGLIGIIDQLEETTEKTKWKANTTSVPPRPIARFQEREITNEELQQFKESLQKVLKEPQTPRSTRVEKANQGQKTLPEVVKPNAVRAYVSKDAADEGLNLAEILQDLKDKDEKEKMPRLAREGAGTSDDVELGMKNMSLEKNKKEHLPPVEKSSARRPKMAKSVSELRQEQHKLPTPEKTVPRVTKVVKVGADVRVVAKGARTRPDPAMSAMPRVA